MLLGRYDILFSDLILMLFFCFYLYRNQEIFLFIIDTKSNIFVKLCLRSCILIQTLGQICTQMFRERNAENRSLRMFWHKLKLNTSSVILQVGYAITAPNYFEFYMKIEHITPSFLSKLSRSLPQNVLVQRTSNRNWLYSPCIFLKTLRYIKLKKFSCYSFRINFPWCNEVHCNIFILGTKYVHIQLHWKLPNWIYSS